MHISKARLVVIDVETTGLSPKDSRIIEIAAVAVLGGEVQDTFHSLIDPQCPLPRHIQRLTGIRQSDLDHAPAAGEVIPAFLEFLGEGIFVAHNVTFDWNMVYGELDRLERPGLTNSKLCTVRLARRLLPKLPSKSLGQLIRFYRLDTCGLHRALNDAHMTAAILERLLKRLQSVYDVSDVDAVLRFQHQSYAKTNSLRRSLARIKSEVLPKVPACPGVYTMLDKSRKIIYVGRSKNLRQRVRSYFAGIESHPEHARKLVGATRDVTWQTTVTELEAVLLESRKIKTHKPRFNRVAVDYLGRPSLRLGQISNRPWVTVVHYVRNDGASYYGPYGSRAEAETLAAILIRLYGRAAGAPRPSDRAAGVGLTAARIGGRLAEDNQRHAQRFLAGEHDDVLRILDRRMRMASARRKYKLAGEYHNWLDFIKALPPAGAFWRRSILDRHGAALFAIGGHVELHFFAQGCPIKTLVVPRSEILPAGAADELFQAVASPNQRLSRRHINDLCLFAQWLRQRVDAVRLVWLTAELHDTSFENDIQGTLNSMAIGDQTNGPRGSTMARLESGRQP